jgi:FkbM family methyltransferase
VLTRALHAALWTRRHLTGQLLVPELPSLLPLLAEDDVFFDVGAHAGGWAVPVSRVLRRGHVYAFEALPHYGKVLKLTLTLLGRRNVTVIIGAVSDREGAVPVMWKDGQGRRLTGKTHIARPGDTGASVSVDALTLDSFSATQAERRLRLLKCDVEGAELMVLRGATSIIERWRPLVFCELYEEYCAKYGYHARDVFEFFATRGYRAYRFAGSAFERFDPDQYSGCGDVLFVPAEGDPVSACA